MAKKKQEATGLDKVHGALQEIMIGASVYWHQREFEHQERQDRRMRTVVNNIEIKISYLKDIALVDTASEYTVIPPELAEIMDNENLMDWLGEEIEHSSLEGRQSARMGKCDITLLANQWGQDLRLEDVTVIVPSRWHRKIVVLGAVSCLEKINMSIVECKEGDGSVSRQYSSFYFAKRDF